MFSDTEGDRANDYNSVLKKFKENCKPRKNERYKDCGRVVGFSTAKQ